MTKITIQKKPTPNSAKYDFATFDMEGDITEKQVIDEFTKIIKELGWFKSDPNNFECSCEFTKCGTSTVEGEEL